MNKNTKIKTYQKGIFAEKLTIFFLILKGYKILKNRYKTGFGEIDILARRSKTIVAIEVKFRSKTQISNEEALQKRQIERLKKALELFILKNPKFHQYKLRIDLVLVNKNFRIKQLKNIAS